MKIKTSILKDKVNLVSRALVKNSVLPVVNNIALINGWLTATNLEMTIAAKIDLAVNILLPSKIVDIINVLPGEDTEFNLVNKTLHITSGSSKFQVTVDDNIEDYPVLEFPSDYDFKIDTKEFFEVLRSVIFAVSADVHKQPIFHGVYFSANNKILSLIASDTFRIAKASIEIDSKDYSVIIPARSLQELLRFNTDILDVKIDEHKVIFKSDDVVLQTRFPAGAYPDISHIISTSFGTLIPAIAEEELASVLKRALIISGSSNVVNMSVTDNKLNVKITGEIGSFNEELVVTQNGNDVDIYFNAEYMVDVLNFRGLSLCFNGSNDPIVFKKEEYDYLYLMLPIKKFSA